VTYHDRTFPVVRPFLGAEAEAYASKLGMPQRRCDELGTSVMIVDTDVALEDIVRGVEDFWWPRIQECLLEPVFVDEDGCEHFAKPASRPDLRPFIEAYDIAIGRAPPIAKRSYFKESIAFADLRSAVSAWWYFPSRSMMKTMCRRTDRTASP
jgi:hypothetical protein